MPSPTLRDLLGEFDRALEGTPFNGPAAMRVRAG
jgi:hypothetical protein